MDGPLSPGREEGQREVVEEAMFTGVFRRPSTVGWGSRSPVFVPSYRCFRRVDPYVNDGCRSSQVGE